MKRWQRRSLTIGLSFVMLMQSMPMNLMKLTADELKESTETEEKIEREFYSGGMVDTYNIGNGYIIQENEEKRTLTTKEYVMSDDTIMIRCYYVV